MHLSYSSKFEKNFKRLPRHIQAQALKKEKIFRLNPGDSRLKTHCLSGKLQGLSSFSINYQFRIVFAHETDQIIFIDVGTHSIYK